MKICMIPVRKSSERLKKKNYLDLDGFLIFEHTIKKAIKSKCYDKIVLNSEDEALRKYAENYSIEFYKRGEYYASSDATADEVVSDFIKEYIQKKYDEVRITWLNTASPLTRVSDIIKFEKENVDCASSVSINNYLRHALSNNKTINFNWTDSFAKTQEMKEITILNYALMSWSSEAFKYIEEGSLFQKDTKLIETSFWTNILNKKKDDFDLIKTLYNEKMIYDL